jgi:hypothetical protein
MSGTDPAIKQEVVATNNVVAFARNGAELVDGFATANPALYAQLVGSLSTYSKSAAAPIVGSLIGLLAAKYGLGPYLSTETVNLLTELLVGAGTVAGAAFMHWYGKRPGRELAAAPATTTTQGATPCSNH